MNKAIILLSGSPAGKNEFLNVARTSCWVWNINFKDLLSNQLKPVTNGEKDERFYDFILEVCKLTNRYYNAEEQYLRSKIRNFQNDADEVKQSPDGTQYESFLLVLHGVSNNIQQVLKDEFGVFQIHVEDMDTNTVSETKDLVLYHSNDGFDKDEFESKVRKTISVLLDN